MSSFEEGVEPEAQNDRLQNKEEDEEEEEEEEEEMGTEISKCVTVIVKAIRHCGTQTLIQCNPDESKENFIDMLINTKL